jgi:hypothetical protein
MSEFVYFTTLCLVLGTVVLVFGMRYVSAVTLADVDTRLAAVEKILKDVG